MHSCDGAKVSQATHQAESAQSGILPQLTLGCVRGLCPNTGEQLFQFLLITLATTSVCQFPLKMLSSFTARDGSYGGEDIEGQCTKIAMRQERKDGLNLDSEFGSGKGQPMSRAEIWHLRWMW